MATERAIRVYISGPITKGNRNRNAFQAFEAQAELLRRGLAPLNPVASVCYPFAWQAEYSHKVWMRCDLAWIEAADAVLRLPGESVGADQEVAFAEGQGIPVFHSMSELLWAANRNELQPTEGADDGRG